MNSTRVAPGAVSLPSGKKSTTARGRHGQFSAPIGIGGCKARGPRVVGCPAVPASVASEQPQTAEEEEAAVVLLSTKTRAQTRFDYATHAHQSESSFRAAKRIRRFEGGLNKACAVAAPSVRLRFASGLPPVRLRFASGSPPVRLRFASGAPLASCLPRSLRNLPRLSPSRGSPPRGTLPLPRECAGVPLLHQVMYTTTHSRR